MTATLVEILDPGDSLAYRAWFRQRLSDPGYVLGSYPTMLESGREHLLGGRATDIQRTRFGIEASYCVWLFASRDSEACEVAMGELIQAIRVADLGPWSTTNAIQNYRALREHLVKHGRSESCAEYTRRFANAINGRAVPALWSVLSTWIRDDLKVEGIDFDFDLIVVDI